MSDISANPTLNEPAIPLSYSEFEADPALKCWYAVYTYPRHERTCVRQLAERSVDAFLPTYATERLRKNRQRVTIHSPVFPSYLFVRIGARERSRVLGVPGILRILGNPRGLPEPIPDNVIDLLRSETFKNRLEPQPEVVAGQRVRIRNGAMRGVEGVLVRRKNSLRFILSIDLINQRAMVEVKAQDIESVDA